MAEELKKNISAFAAEAPCSYPSTHSTQGESCERKKGIYAEIHCPEGSLVPEVAPGEPTLSVGPGREIRAGNRNQSQEGSMGPKQPLAVTRGAAGMEPSHSSPCRHKGKGRKRRRREGGMGSH